MARLLKMRLEHWARKNPGRDGLKHEKTLAETARGSPHKPPPHGSLTNFVYALRAASFSALAAN